MTNSANFRTLRVTLLFTALSVALVLFVLWSSGAFPLLLRPWFLAGLGLLLVLATLVTRKSTRDDDGNRPAGPFFTELLLELRQNLLELAVLSLPAAFLLRGSAIDWSSVFSQLLYALPVWLALAVGRVLVHTRWCAQPPPESPAPQ